MYHRLRLFEIGHADGRNKEEEELCGDGELLCACALDFFPWLFGDGFCSSLIIWIAKECVYLFRIFFLFSGVIFCFSWRLESSSYVVRNLCCREGRERETLEFWWFFLIESLVDYKYFEVFESACVAEVMKRRREGSCEYSRRNIESRRCGKMTESRYLRI